MKYAGEIDSVSSDSAGQGRTTDGPTKMQLILLGPTNVWIHYNKETLYFACISSSRWSGTSTALPQISSTYVYDA
jgi:hypothetical protein